MLQEAMEQGHWTTEGGESTRRLQKRRMADGGWRDKNRNMLIGYEVCIDSYFTLLHLNWLSMSVFVWRVSYLLWAGAGA